MIIHAELKRKQSEYEGEACAVDKVIELPAQRFQQFSRVLLADYDFIAENKNTIRHVLSRVLLGRLLSLLIYSWRAPLISSSSSGKIFQSGVGKKQGSRRSSR